MPLSMQPGLDNCHDHSDDVRGYHYHVAGAGENMFIGCIPGEQGSVPVLRRPIEITA